MRNHVGVIRWMVAFAAFFSCAFAHAEYSDVDEWLIHPDRVGPLSSMKKFGYEEWLYVTVGDVLRLYPRTLVTIERGHPGILWRDRWEDTSRWYFVFRQDGKQLFRSECNCKPTLDGKWSHPGVPSTFASDMDVRISPIITDARFHTAEGIRVGSTVKQLRDAYPNFSQALRAYSQGPGSLDPQEKEYLCFKSKGANPRRDTVERMIFYVRPAKGSVRVGKYNNSTRPDGDSGTRIIDPNAVIVAIEVSKFCFHD